MGPNKNPGLLGLRRGSAIDRGTLARIPTAPPRVIGVPSDLPGLEGITKSIAITRAMAYADDVDGLEVGWVYFVVSDDEVRHSDQFGLQNLVKSLKKRVSEGFIIKLICEGSTDYRGTEWDNMGLGKRRAKSVSQYLMHSAPGVMARPKSIGESNALKPKKGIRPPLSAIKKDRLVTIKFAENGFLPPVRLSVESTGMGKWKNWGSTIERLEVNSGGKVAPMEGSRGDVSAREENEYMRSGKTKERPGSYDPFRVVATIKCQYSEKPTSGGIESKLQCDVVHKRTGKVLFSGAAKGHRTVPSSPSWLDAAVYAKLRGRHKNITERVRASLRRK